MDRRLVSVALALVAVLIAFLLIVWIGGAINPDLQLDETALLRFVFVVVGLLIVFVVYWLTRSSGAWDVGTREVVYMAIGAALYAIFSYLFNGTVFVVPSVSQVALRPAIAIPMFFGYAFGPAVGFFSGAVTDEAGDIVRDYAEENQGNDRSDEDDRKGLSGGDVFDDVLEEDDNQTDEEDVEKYQHDEGNTAGGWLASALQFESSLSRLSSNHSVLVPVRKNNEIMVRGPLRTTGVNRILASRYRSPPAFGGRAAMA